MSCCGDKENYAMVDTGVRVPIVFMNRSKGRTIVTGPATKTKYGYRKQGDRFHVYEADIRARPDIFVPEAEILRQARERQAFIDETAAQIQADQVETVAPPPAPPSAPIESNIPKADPEDDQAPVNVRSTRLGVFDPEKPINRTHIAILADNGIVTVQDVLTIGMRMTQFKGIGAKIAERIVNWCKDLVDEGE